MQRSDVVAGLERLADAFVALVPGAPGLSVDRQTQAPPNAVGWHSGRNFRVRLRQHPAAGQASAYFRVAPGGLEQMLATSVAREVGVGTDSISSDAEPDGVWSTVRVPQGEEPLTARRVVQRLRRRVA